MPSRAFFSFDGRVEKQAVCLLSTDAPFFILSRFAPGFSLRQRRSHAVNSPPYGDIFCWQVCAAAKATTRSSWASVQAEWSLWPLPRQAMTPKCSVRSSATRAAARPIGGRSKNPPGLAETIARFGPTCDLMIIDCLTFFAANLLDAQGDEQSPIEALCMALQFASLPGRAGVERGVAASSRPIHRAGASGDLLGEMNQSVARVASNVLLLVAGLPLVLKGNAEVPQ